MRGKKEANAPRGLSDWMAEHYEEYGCCGDADDAREDPESG